MIHKHYKEVKSEGILDRSGRLHATKDQVCKRWSKSFKEIIGGDIDLG